MLYTVEGLCVDHKNYKPYSPLAEYRKAFVRITNTFYKIGTFIIDHQFPLPNVNEKITPIVSLQILLFLFVCNKQMRLNANEL